MEPRAALCQEVPILAGHRIGITADRRADEQAELLRQVGAEVVVGPVLRTLPLADDQPLRDATDAVLRDPPQVVLMSTGIGMRSWLGAAEAWGSANALWDALDGALLFARGPKAFAAAVQAGLTVWRREPTERLEVMVDHLLADGVAGLHIVIQLHGDAVPWAVAALEGGGARVTAVPIYRWVPPDDEGPARRVIRDAVDGNLSALTFTSTSAVRSTCRFADADGLLDGLIAASRSGLVVGCVGPVTRSAAVEQGLEVACTPPAGRLGLLVRSVASTLRGRHIHLSAGGADVLVQGSLVATEHTRVALSDRERQVLQVLAGRPGAVVSRDALAREVWGSTDHDGAMDALLSRLRRQLAPTGLEITTRVRRGYQLLADTRSCPAPVDPVPDRPDPAPAVVG